METHNMHKKYACSHCDFSSNTLSYMKIHYTKMHKGLQYQVPEEGIGNEGVSQDVDSQVKVEVGMTWRRDAVSGFRGGAQQ